MAAGERGYNSKRQPIGEGVRVAPIGQDAALKVGADSEQAVGFTSDEALETADRPDDSVEVCSAQDQVSVAQKPSANLPSVAQSETAPRVVLPFSGPRNVAPATALESDGATRGTSGATRGADGGHWTVDYVRASENTYAFRLRWAVGRKRGTPLYVSRVSAKTFYLIREMNYEGFKQSLIASQCESALRSGNAAH